MIPSSTLILFCDLAKLQHLGSADNSARGQDIDEAREDGKRDFGNQVGLFAHQPIPRRLDMRGTMRDCRKPRTRITGYGGSLAISTSSAVSLWLLTISRQSSRREQLPRSRGFFLSIAKMKVYSHGLLANLSNDCRVC